MGDESPSRVFVAMLFIGTSVLIPFFMPKWLQRRFVVVLLFLLFLGSGFWYSHLESRYVVALSDGVTFVIRGSIRNPKLQEPYASMTDQDLIEYSGARDADLQKSYVWESVEANREKIFWSYVCSLLALQLMLGYGAFIGKAAHPEPF